MESHEPMTHLQLIELSIQDLAQATADLATVMGPAQAGQLDQQHLQEQLQSIGAPPPSTFQSITGRLRSGDADWCYCSSLRRGISG